MFYQVFIAYLDVIRQFGCDKNALSVAECAGGLVLDAVPANNAVKKRKGIPVLNHLVILAYHAQDGIVIGPNGGEIVRDFDLGDDDIGIRVAVLIFRIIGEKGSFFHRVVQPGVLDGLRAGRVILDNFPKPVPRLLLNAKKTVLSCLFAVIQIMRHKIDLNSESGELFKKVNRLLPPCLRELLWAYSPHPAEGTRRAI